MKQFMIIIMVQRTIQSDDIANLGKDALLEIDYKGMIKIKKHNSKCNINLYTSSQSRGIEKQAHSTED